MKKCIMKESITASSNMTREQYMEAIEDLLNDTGRYDLESILYQHGAAEDARGPEGYYRTMSDKDIEDAYNDILSALSPNTPSARTRFYVRLKKRPYDSLSLYEKGFVDRYEAAQRYLNMYSV